jgi:polyhydroxyalkanoate synthesis repressor PhaR
MSELRIIKRYTNRKLYDTRDSRYVTLSQIAAMVRAGEEMTVIDNATKEDLTSLTLAQIIYEQEKRQAEVLPLSALRELVRRSEARLADLREGRVGRFLARGEGGDDVDESEQTELPEGSDVSSSTHDHPEEGEAHKGLIESSRLTFEDWQRRVDDQLRTLLDKRAPFRQLQDEIRRVTQRIEELEGRLRRLPIKRKDEIETATSDVKESEGARE